MILAFDPATTTGWAFITRDPLIADNIESGVVDTGDGPRLRAIVGMARYYGVEKVVVEFTPVAGGFRNGLESRLNAIRDIEHACGWFGIDRVLRVNVNTWRKGMGFPHRGAGAKQAAMDYVTALGIKPATHDEAEAICIARFVLDTGWDGE